MTDDLVSLLDHLKTGPVDVLGWSDGGIEALLLGIRHPASGEGQEDRGDGRSLEKLRSLAGAPGR